MQIERGHGNAPVRAPRPAASGATKAPAPEASSPPAPPTEVRGPARGVVDKLASGHFNDVAAIRLRINHADAIAASGVTLPDVPTTSSQPGRGFEKALAAYEATRSPAVPDQPATTDDPAAVDPVVTDPAVVTDPDLTDPVAIDVVVDPVIDGAELVEDLLAGVDGGDEPADAGTAEPALTS